MSAAPPPVPPFCYGPTAPNFPMTTGNSIPAMVVWLFLVTNPQFLIALDPAPEGAEAPVGLLNAIKQARPRGKLSTKTTAVTVPVQDIADATNLTADCVRDILAIFSKNSNDQKKQAFYTVAGAFQDYSSYQPSNCPGRPAPILQLAKSGAAVDPNAG